MVNGLGGTPITELGPAVRPAHKKLAENHGFRSYVGELHVARDAGATSRCSRDAGFGALLAPAEIAYGLRPTRAHYDGARFRRAPSSVSGWEVVANGLEPVTFEPTDAYDHDSEPNGTRCGLIVSPDVPGTVRRGADPG
jgi:hypothetical protein